MLEFIVDGQLLRRKDGERILSGSVGFLKFRACFSPEWEGYTKTFLFKGKNKEAYCVFAVEDSQEYEVPHEVLAQEGRVEVSVFGASRLTNLASANSVILSVEKSGLGEGWIQSDVATPGLYEQICHKLEETLKALPEKQPMLQCREDGVYWKLRESELWTLLFSLDQIRGKDGSLWHQGDQEPERALGKEGDFYFQRATACIFAKKQGEWEKHLDPQEIFLPLVSSARQAADEACLAKEESLALSRACQDYATRCQEPLSDHELYPGSFTLWSSYGPMSEPVLGEELFPLVMEPEAVYRVEITPGKAYRFTPVPAAEYGNYYFAVVDREGRCLDYTHESIGEYAVRESYDGRVPAYIYYGVKDVSRRDISFREESTVAWMKRSAQDVVVLAEECESQAHRSEQAAQEAQKAKEQGASLVEQCRDYARQSGALVQPVSLYPGSFVLWSKYGPMSEPVLGEELFPVVMEPEGVYRVEITPGETYFFTPVPAAEYGNYYFAVVDREGRCLDYTHESIGEYTVRESYDGKTPAYIYYGVKDVSQGEIRFETESVLQRMERRAEGVESLAEQALASAEECGNYVQQTKELLTPSELYPGSFTLWSDYGPMSEPVLGEEIFPLVLEPAAVYRVAITPGRSYRFTPVPAAQYGNYYFAVVDREGRCLDYTAESIGEYTVRGEYNGSIPAYIYYGVEDISQRDLFFCEAGLLPLYRRLQETEELCRELERRLLALENQ